MEWDPDLEVERRAHLRYAQEWLPSATGGAIYVRCGERAVIITDPALEPRLRRAVLTHELIHDGLAFSACIADMPATSDAVVARE